MAIEVNDADWSIRLHDAPQEGQGNGVIAAQRDDPRQS